ncbi:hypothetical protein NLG97_g9810 [Lecanicillium saksenae]|uniref:Uncharacterized protein n=1 Tax=Lecanicillium saksenae TaxID=468837 RepID=A0ACC1QI82_9HYPO|nr:hypothetical protein NLG97_g9810 [Lecanicillium saksenae]
MRQHHPPSRFQRPTIARILGYPGLQSRYRTKIRSIDLPTNPIPRRARVGTPPPRHHDRLLLLHLRPPQYAVLRSSAALHKANLGLSSPLAECIYSKSWLPASVTRPSSSAGATATATASVPAPVSMTSSDDAKLIFGTVFSLRNMARKLGGDDDAFISYRTGQYKLHFYETPANLRFVLLTDTASASMRNVLHQIYINLWVEYVVKNPLAPVEHKGGDGVQNELFELGCALRGVLGAHISNVRISEIARGFGIANSTAQNHGGIGDVRRYKSSSVENALAMGHHVTEATMKKIWAGSLALEQKC